MESLRLFGDMPTTIRIALSVQLTKDFEALIENIKQDFITIFHACQFKKRRQI